MSTGVELLRLLEPTVRPGGLQGPKSAPTEPIESRSFESLLEEAKATAATTTTESMNETTTKPSRQNDPLGALARVDLIDNAALLRIIGTDRAGTARLAE